EHDHLDGIVLDRTLEEVVQLVEQTVILRIAGFGPFEHDPGDRVAQLIADELRRRSCRHADWVACHLSLRIIRPSTGRLHIYYTVVHNSQAIFCPVACKTHAPYPGSTLTSIG